jgi:NAD(P)-dependent dehydrogenase (short-subunit alcohol dehydrogenase family)
MRFSGKTALVAGAGGGMGFEIASQLISQGVNVALADIKEQPDNIPDGPGEWIYAQCNLTDADAVKNLVATTVDRFGGIEYLVNTLGVLWIGKDKAVEDIDMEVWDQVFNINLRSIALIVKYAVPHMKKADAAAMVHFSSIDALSGDMAPQDAYGASKAALIRLSKSLATQYAADQVRSNVILPGPALTPMQERWQGKPDLQSSVAKHIPIGRLGKAEDMANAALFLLSDNASYITGTELVVDGGLTALP